MNQNANTLMLWHYMAGREGWGRHAGARVWGKLEGHIAGRPRVGLWRLSLQNVKRVDVGFASVAIVGLVEHCQPDIHVCLVNVTDADVAENITAAAERMAVPVTVWNDGNPGILGPAPRSALGDALAFAFTRPAGVRACDYAPAAGISITNASSRFKELWERGYLLRQQTVASSGGTEFIYRPIG